ncbi:MAG: carboxypeptidase regulatory-like domain-containing protein, partial [Kofleriaceae bacterium]|nr:carboxypeptidase regulatory-like domain-containing protein [Kofleriaceae bacterium]
PDDPMLRSETTFSVAPGEHRTDVDLVLRKGGVELTGTISDINGGPISNARVRAQIWGSDNRGGAPITSSDTQGRYKLWVRAGHSYVTADADGYATTNEGGDAPGVVDLKLTPESAIAGVVKDQRGEPVAGALVSFATDSAWFAPAASASDISDAQGRFRITRLRPGRYKAEAQAARGYGMARESILLGLGQVVEGVEVVLRTASYVEGKVLRPEGDGKQPCKRARLTLNDAALGQSEMSVGDAQGVVRIRGILPGHYKVRVQCEGYQDLATTENVVVVRGEDRTGLTWTVTQGASLVGTITNQAGEPVANAQIYLRSKDSSGPRPNSNMWAGTDELGHYQMRGLAASTYQMKVSADAAPPPKDPPDVVLTVGTVVTKDIVLDTGGTVRASIVDSAGVPVKGARVFARNVAQEGVGMAFPMGGARESGTDGVATLEGLRAGTYRITARRAWQKMRKPGSTDDDEQGERVEITAGGVTNVKLVVESQRGEITGTVADNKGEIVSDAYIAAEREPEAAGAAQQAALATTRWSWNDAVLTDPAGKFTVKDLAPGKYTVRAYRKGGGEAIVEHVALGANVALVVKPTGTIEGTVRALGGKLAAEEFTVEVVDRATNFSRSEDFYAVDGTFAMHDLPAGRFEITATVGAATGTEKIVLREGEVKAGVALIVGNTVTVTGTLVDEKTKAPVQGMQVHVAPLQGGNNLNRLDGDPQRISDVRGRFSVDNVAVGEVSIYTYSMNPDFGWARISTRAQIPATATGTFDIGTFGAIAKRLKPGKVAGDAGLSFQQNSDSRVPLPLTVARVDPAGPAAKLDIKVGDVVVAIDGVDITGTRNYLRFGLFDAAPGTKLELTLARGVNVVLTLVPPK